MNNYYIYIYLDPRKIWKIFIQILNMKKLGHI